MHSAVSLVPCAYVEAVPLEMSRPARVWEEEPSAKKFAERCQYWLSGWCHVQSAKKSERLPSPGPGHWDRVVEVEVGDGPLVLVAQVAAECTPCLQRNQSG